MVSMADPHPHYPEPGFRSADDEHDYWQKRAEDHRQLAEKAKEAGTRAIHVRLQQLYAEQSRASDIVRPD
jgi:hypothetical protein